MILQKLCHFTKIHLIVEDSLIYEFLCFSLYKLHPKIIYQKNGQYAKPGIIYIKLHT